MNQTTEDTGITETTARIGHPTSERGASDDDVLTAEDVALWLKMTPAWVRAHARRDRRPHLPAFKAGKYVRFRRGAVRAALKKWEDSHTEQNKGA